MEHCPSVLGELVNMVSFREDLPRLALLWERLHQMHCDERTPLTDETLMGLLQSFSVENASIRPAIQKLKEKVEAERIRLSNLEKKSEDSHRGRYWSEKEHSLYLDAVALYGEKDVKMISKHIGTRTVPQVRTHAQKYHLKLEKEENGTQKKRKEPSERVSHQKKARDSFSPGVSGLFMPSILQNWKTHSLPTESLADGDQTRPLILPPLRGITDGSMPTPPDHTNLFLHHINYGGMNLVGGHEKGWTPRATEVDSETTQEMFKTLQRWPVSGAAVPDMNWPGMQQQ